MANPYTGSVAAALRKSQLLLESAPAGGLHQAAVQDAVVLQLWLAYRAFLCELAHQLQLGSQPESPGQLARDAASRGMSSSEAAELEALAGDPESWLAGIEAAWLGLWQFSGSRASQGNGAGSPAQVIPLRDLSRQSAAPDLDALRNWRESMVELIRRQRAHMEEY
ncbi:MULTISPECIES: DUF6586 family protein [Microbulbifer]|uniref:DUF6586 family protein n=1 Tax=Microbulbifer TaxID=48073 RepID=UPI001E57DD11|nr:MULTISPECIES: DUF6586 family protein [Microbulbifer]UHQ55837.1 hypothetical protein LVE68_02275 [Microbulbifer sp. YPW16]